MAKSLKPRQENPIDLKLVVLMSILFFVLAFLVGEYFRHYPSLTGVI